MEISKQILYPALSLFVWCLPALGFATTTIPVTDFTDVVPPANPVPGSLRDAINQAQDGDTVSIPTAQINLGGEIQVLKSITLQGAGAGATIIDGGGNDRIFQIGNGSTANSVKIAGVGIQNGSTLFSGGGISLENHASLLLEESHIGPDNTAGNDGGGIFSDGALTIVQSTIDGNHSHEFGGGVSCNFGTAVLTDTTVSNNDADSVVNGEGGGVFAGEFCNSITLQGTALGIGGCNIIGNTSAGRGGGIQSESQTLVDTCTISGNTANGSAGGGGITNDGSMTILNSVITGNHAVGDSIGGGGIFNEGPMIIDHTTISNNDTKAEGGGGGGGIDSILPLTITNTTISENHANGINSNGGGLWSSGNPSDISNTTIFGNDATGNGGGVFSNNSGLHLNNVTIANNTADKDGDNIGNGGGTNGFQSLSIRNTLIAGNFDNSPGGPQDKDCSSINDSSLVSEGHNLIDVVDKDCVITGDPTGNIINQPAGLDPNGLQANGSSGPLTAALVTGSRAINAGDTTTSTATDERGITRPQGLASDIGAFEFVTLPLNTPPPTTPPPVTPPPTTPPPSPVPTPTLTPTSLPTPVPPTTPVTPRPGNGGNLEGGGINLGGCSLTALADVDVSEWMSLLPFAAVGFVTLRRLVK